MKRIAIATILCLCYSIFYAQSGVKIYTGLTTGFNKDKIVTPDGHMHYGYEVGVDAMLNDDRMYFMLGGKYGTVDLLSSSSANFFSKDKMTYFKGRVGLGFDMIKLSSKAFITSRVLGSMQYALTYDQSLLTEEGYQKINEGTAGLVAGVGYRYRMFNIDVEYEHGLFNLYYKKKNTSMSYLSLLFGINF